MTHDRPGEPFVLREIHRQPSAWRRAADLAGELSGVLPRDGERVAVLGCGTSWFMAASYAMLREASGQGETDYFAASQFSARRAYDRVVAITRSGTTTEVVRALEASAGHTVVLTAVPDMPVTDAADDTVVLDFADEQSVVQTLFATTVLTLLRASLGDDVAPSIEQAAAVLAGAFPLDAAARSASQFSFLGQDWVFGLAQEAALKMREAAQLWTEAYPQMEYRHGPIAIAEPGRATWIFGRPVGGLLADLEATGAAVVDDELDPMADLMRAQLLAARRALDLGLDPDHPRHLTRSVVLSA